MSLKKALNKLKTGSSHSNPASDDETSKTPASATVTPSTANGLRAQSPGATPRSSGIFSHRASGDLKRSEVASPTDSRSSLDQGPRHSLTGLLGRRTDSPNRGSKSNNHQQAWIKKH